VAEVERRFAEKQQKEKEKEENGSAIPLLDPVTDMGLDSDAYRSASARATSLREALRSHPLSTDPKLESKISALRRRQGLAAALAAAVASERDAAGLLLGSELRARVRVLRKLGYLEEAEEGGNGGEGTVRVDDDRSVVTVKGRAAAELSSAGGAELALAEALFGGGLSGMRPEHLAALLSCLVWQEPSSGGGGGNSGGSNAASAVLARVGGAPPPPRAPEALDGPLAALRAAARRVSRVERDVGLFDESSGSGGGAGTAGSSSSSSGSPDDAAAALLSTEPADAVLAWARGARFVDALRLCGGSGSSSNRPAFEGSLVRALRRVDELLRQLGSAAEVLGDETLVALAKVAGDKVRRGVPFAPSLYL
jgi:ATP-dependent RNA helicase DOB1